MAKYRYFSNSPYNTALWRDTGNKTVIQYFYNEEGYWIKSFFQNYYDNYSQISYKFARKIKPEAFRKNARKTEKLKNY